MKLSHAASWTRTAIAELRRAIGVGSGALLGVMVKLKRNCRAYQMWATSKLAHERSACYLLDNSIPNPFPVTQSSASPDYSRRHMARRKNLTSSCGDTYQSSHQRCNHPENGAVASVTREPCEASNEEKAHIKSKRKAGAIAAKTLWLVFYLAYWYEATTKTPVLPIGLLAATGMPVGAILYLLVLATSYDDKRMTPNVQSSGTAAERDVEMKV